MFSVNPILIVAVAFITYCNQGAQQQEQIVESVTEEQVVLNDSFAIDHTMSKVIWSGKALGI